MRADLYTKAVLTVIAAALVWLGINHTALPVAAQADNVQKVAIVGLDKTLRGLPVLLVNADGQSILDGDMVRAVIANHSGQVVPVGISAIGRAQSDSPWQSIPVDVIRQPAQAVPGEQ